VLLEFAILAVFVVIAAIIILAVHWSR